MKLRNLIGHNFMPYREIELEFPQDEYCNTMVIFGDNMRGKTSILNAIRWVFYGEAIKRHSRTIPLQDIVNKDATKEKDWTVDVQVGFDANNHSYELCRKAHLKESVTVPSNTEDFEQSMSLTCDGETIPRGQIEEVIGFIVPEQISRFFLFDGELLQEYETLLINDDRQGKQIKEKIEQVLGIPTLTKGYTDTQTILKQARKEQSRYLKRIEGVKSQAEQQMELTAQIDSIDTDLNDLKRKLEKVRDEKFTLEDELEKFESIIEAKGTLDAKKDEKKSLDDEYKEIEEERLDVMSEAWKDLIDTQLQTKRSQLEKHLEVLIDSIKDQGRLEATIFSLRKLLDKKECPICRQAFSEKYQYEVEQDIEKNRHTLQTIKNEQSTLQDISIQLDALSKVSSIDAKNRLSRIEHKLMSHRIRINKVEDEIEELKDEIKEYDNTKITRKRMLCDEKIREEDRLVSDIDGQKTKRQELSTQLEILQKLIDNVTNHLPSQKISIKVDVCCDLDKIFFQSIEQVRDKLKAKVETRAKEAFKRMITQQDYQGLKINDNYGLKIIDASGDYVNVRSAGAEQIVALSLIDGLNRTGRSIGPVIMDTPFGRLDLKHRANILKYFPSVANQFVLLVHSGEIREEDDLKVIRERIGATYRIKEISSTRSCLEKVDLG